MSSAVGRSVVLVTCAPAGSGKTYVRCARFLPLFFRDGGVKHISNFPIERDAMRQFLEESGYLPAAEFDERVITFPPAVLHDWELERSGPWDYFKDKDLTGAHIALDEAHNVIGVHHSKKHKEAWASWLGEIRHRGATIEFLSQDPSKLAAEVGREAAVRLSLVSSQERRDPFLKIPLSDWYELLAKLRGRYIAMVWCVERRKVDGAWRAESVDAFTLEEKYFKLYDSHSLPTRGGVKVTDVRREWQKRSWPQLLRWFVQRHFGSLSWRLLVAAVVVWLLFFGGMQRVVGWGMGRAANYAAGWMKGTAAHSIASQQASAAPSSVPGVVPPGAAVPVNANPAVEPGKVVPDGVSSDAPISLVLVADAWCVGNDGVVRRVGDPWGSLGSVESIRFTDRSVVLSGGVVVRLSSASHASGSPASQPVGDDVSDHPARPAPVEQRPVHHVLSTTMPAVPAPASNQPANGRFRGRLGPPR